MVVVLIVANVQLASFVVPAGCVCPMDNANHSAVGLNVVLMVAEVHAVTARQG